MAKLVDATIVKIDSAIFSNREKPGCRSHAEMEIQHAGLLDAKERIRTEQPY